MRDRIDPTPPPPTTTTTDAPFRSHLLFPHTHTHTRARTAVMYTYYYLMAIKAKPAWLKYVRPPARPPVPWTPSTNHPLTTHPPTAQPHVHHGDPIH